MHVSHKISCFRGTRKANTLMAIMTAFNAVVLRSLKQFSLRKSQLCTQQPQLLWLSAQYNFVSFTKLVNKYLREKSVYDFELTFTIAFIINLDLVFLHPRKFKKTINTNKFMGNNKGKMYQGTVILNTSLHIVKNLSYLRITKITKRKINIKLIIKFLLYGHSFSSFPFTKR